MAKILLAEDDASLRGFIMVTLEKAGHDVTGCADGLEAFTAFNNHPIPYFDLLLSDIVMPGMDGMELSGHLKAVQPDIRVMFITGFAGMLVEENTKTTVVSKPFHLGTLVREVDQALSA